MKKKSIKTDSEVDPGIVGDILCKLIWRNAKNLTGGRGWPTEMGGRGP